mgnify:CR=1 FL=1
MRLALIFCALALPVGAQTDIGNLTPQERASFAEEMRAFLMAEPDLVARALAPRNYAAEAYQQKADDDRAMLDRLSAQVLSGADVALFVDRDCAECDAARVELRAFSDRYGTTFTLHDMADPEGAALAEKLGMTDAPFYVLPDMILRGQMPVIVLGKYLNR